MDPLSGLVTLQAKGRGLGSVLLAPGFTGSKEDFLELIPLLRDLGWSVVAVDHRGQCHSPHDPNGDYSLRGWAADLCTVAQHQPRPVHLVGHSLGGLIAAEAATRFEWASVTLLNSGSGPIHQSQRDRLKLLITALESFAPEQIWDAKTQMDRAQGWQPPSPEVEDFMRERFLATDPASLVAMAQILLSGPHVDLSQVASPVLVAFGADDPDSWSWQTQVDLAQRSRARLVLIPDAAHSPAVEAPRATAGVLAGLFVAGTDTRGVEPPANGYVVDMQLLAPLDADTTAIGRARRIVADQLWGWGMSELAQDAELVTSELVTNAIRHGIRPVELRLTTLPDRVRIAVLDSNTQAVPESTPAEDLDEGGRGLALIEHLCLDWGHEVGPSGKQVWAELAA